MTPKTVLHLVGPEEVHERKVDRFDPDEPQYRKVDGTRVEVYHFKGRTQDGRLIYELVGTEERVVPSVRSSS